MDLYLELIAIIINFLLQWCPCKAVFLCCYLFCCNLYALQLLHTASLESHHLYQEITAKGVQMIYFPTWDSLKKGPVSLMTYKAVHLHCYLLCQKLYTLQLLYTIG